MLQPPVLFINHKNGINTFSVGIYSAKCLIGNILSTVRDKEVSKETIHCESNGHVTSSRDPNADSLRLGLFSGPTTAEK